MSRNTNNNNNGDIEVIYNRRPALYSPETFKKWQKNHPFNKEEQDLNLKQFVSNVRLSESMTSPSPSPSPSPKKAKTQSRKKKSSLKKQLANVKSQRNLNTPPKLNLNNNLNNTSKTTPKSIKRKRQFSSSSSSSNNNSNNNSSNKENMLGNNTLFDWSQEFAKEEGPGNLPPITRVRRSKRISKRISKN